MKKPFKSTKPVASLSGSVGLFLPTKTPSSSTIPQAKTSFSLSRPGGSLFHCTHSSTDYDWAASFSLSRVGQISFVFLILQRRMYTAIVSWLASLRSINSTVLALSLIHIYVSCERQYNIRKYFTMGRHSHIDTFYLCQTYSQIQTQLICDNANLIVLFR